ncbi:stage II sporulation protein R [Pelagirhabdus alkalitolerans]|uniref:Stage II sporulation protein R n=1 Tax=Pelagirhabdus alkalitolerans TaxID=1612202 RepID=A0A1G6GHX6_9BACI|nr:stage II sporulation protein R [Pelagirhabdus alkalitolerans]SDB81499.1 stage II sporulation protein R [Pelagirhabdus alkalitolerans]
MISIIQSIHVLVVLLYSFYPTIEADYHVIPDEAIRLRILAEDDRDTSQALKLEVKDEVVQLIDDWVMEIDQIEQARNLIHTQLDEIEDVVNEILEENGHDLEVSIDYDDEVGFPAKVYDGAVYPAGEYEAILITLGEGKGSNWWCVLFPPLCFVDFSSEAKEQPEQDAEVESEDEDVEVSFFLLEWFR